MRKTRSLELVRHGENSSVVFRPDIITNDVLAKEDEELFTVGLWSK
jgi:hypothetical protein